MLMNGLRNFRMKKIISKQSYTLSLDKVKKNIQFIYTAILYLRLINTYCHGLQTNFVYYEPTTTEIG